MEQVEQSVRAAARTEHIATDANPFHFTDCGLSYVYLVGVKYFSTSEGETIAEIPAIEQLMRMIARDVVYCRGPLTGEQIRFLRKRLGMKAGDYARFLRVDTSTLSRFENDKQNPSDQTDSLIRMSYILLCGDPQLAKEANRLKEEITATIRRSQMKIVMKVTESNEWHELKTAA